MVEGLLSVWVRGAPRDVQREASGELPSVLCANDLSHSPLPRSLDPRGEPAWSLDFSYGGEPFALLSGDEASIPPAIPALLPNVYLSCRSGICPLQQAVRTIIRSDIPPRMIGWDEPDQPGPGGHAQWSNARPGRLISPGNRPSSPPPACARRAVRNRQTTTPVPAGT